MTTFEQILGQVIAEQRRKVGLSQEALADLCGVHATYISQLERGLKSPTVRVLRGIAKALGTLGSKLLAAAEAQ
ncbi:helix-turn-helix domain-containing protein [Tahibacter harae]|uniref:Helix-turn-helix domain-containing protein n=1 Tax=Tahibacter harae TaxID=2963937 RepID=A0ABT1QYQ6_9GAMM|nr:helix-turn-helix domain-containing protein [Tahibacter harae]